MTSRFRVLRRLGYTVAALALVAAVGLPGLRAGQASALQLASRSITLSDDGASGGTITSGEGSGTGVTYQVGFTTSAPAQSLIIDFCSNDPIIADTCTAPTGMSASGAAIQTVSGGGNITSAGWSITASTSQVQLAMGSGSATSTGAQVFNLTGITNPSTVGSFYARIYTYADTLFGAGAGQAYISAAGTAPTGGPGDYVDYGGVALSTAQVITITARVQETLTFCVSGTIQTSWTTHTCSDTHASDPPAVTLGHGGVTKILDSSAVDTGNVYSQISTNATHGAVINLTNSNTACGGLSANGGTSCAIPAIGATAAPIVAGTADFGMFAATPANDAGTGATGASSFTVNPTYGTTSDYGMDVTSTSNVKTAFGSQVEATTAPCYLVDDAYTFGATASLTTPAGIYTANMDLIATGTF